jgi:hypothetical protein
MSNVNNRCRKNKKDILESQKKKISASFYQESVCQDMCCDCLRTRHRGASGAVRRWVVAPHVEALQDVVVP